MIFPVQNSYSFSLIQAWGGEMNKQREAEIVWQARRLRLSESTALTEEAEMISLPAWVSNALKCPFRTTHAVKQQAWKSENTQLLFSMLDYSGQKEILSKKQDIIISQRAPWVVVALLTSLENSSYFLLFLPETQTRAVQLCCGLDEAPDGWACWAQATPTPSPSPCAADGLSGLLMLKRWNKNPAMRWWLDCNHRRNGRS